MAKRNANALEENLGDDNNQDEGQQTEGQEAAAAAKKVEDEAKAKEAVIKAAFDAEMANEGHDEDSVKLAMIGAGATFKNVTRLYNQFLVDAGLAVSKDDRDKIVAEQLEGLAFESKEDFEAAVAKLTPAITGATDKSAAALIRAYAKAKELPVYIKPKGEGSARAGLTSNLYDHIISDPFQTEDQLKEYVTRIAEETKSENFLNHLSSHQGVLKLARRVAEKYSLKAES